MEISWTGSHLVFLAGDVYHVAADPAGDHLNPSGHGAVGRRQLVWPDGRHRGGRGGGGGARGDRVGAAPVLGGVDGTPLQQGLSLDVIIRHDVGLQSSLCSPHCTLPATVPGLTGASLSVSLENY